MFLPLYTGKNSMKFLSTSIFAVALLSCTSPEQHDLAATANVEIDQNSTDSSFTTKLLYLNVWGSGRTEIGWRSHLLIQKKYIDAIIPFHIDLPVTESFISVARQKFDWKDSVILTFDAEVDVNGDNSLCKNDYRTVASDYFQFTGVLPESKNISINVDQISDDSSCLQLPEVGVMQ
jgi:hypothetical protein